MSGPWNVILFASIAISLFGDVTSTSPVRPAPIPMCRARNCRLIQQCHSNLMCKPRSANLRCIPPDADNICGKSNKLALLVGRPEMSSSMKPRVCHWFMPCPVGTTCHGGHCCYGRLSRSFIYCKQGGCNRACPPEYSCQRIMASCGIAYACLPAVKPGVCPKRPPGAVVRCARPYMKHCNNDGDCHNNMKCCKGPCETNCKVPNHEKEIVLKPGNCPFLDPRIRCSSPFENIVDKCKQDGECEGKQKCCPSHCAGKMCKNPQFPVIKPGDCPRFFIAIACERDDEKLCNDDSVCSGQMKCCQTACRGTKCQIPAPTIIDPHVKPGQCLMRSAGIICNPFAQPVSNCKSDADCKGHDKCCTQKCGGKQCQPAVMQ